MDRTEISEATELRPLSELSEADVWAMVDASPDGMILTDEHGTILFVNSRIETLFGHDRGELLGQEIEVLLPHDSRRIHTAHRTRYRAQPTTRAMGSGLDLRACRQDGTEFPVEISLSPVQTSDGLRVVATVRDISERLAIEAHAHAVLHTIDEARDGVFMFTHESLRFSYVNRGAVNQLGYSEAELLTMTPIHIKPGFTERTFRELLAPLLAGEADSHTFTTVHRRADGTDLPVEIILEYPPAAGPEKPRLLVALVRDISDRLETEQAVHEQRAQLKVLEDRERLARDLHDVVIQRLFAVGMGVQALQHLATDPRLATRLSDTVGQLDETIAELRTAIFGLTDPAEDTIRAQIESRIDEATVHLGHTPSFHLDGDVESTPASVAAELLPALTEALSNVARHADATSSDIAITVADSSLVLTVIDDGVGLDLDAERGNGLTNLEARARKVGGDCSTVAGTDGGTTMTWTARFAD